MVKADEPKRSSYTVKIRWGSGQKELSKIAKLTEYESLSKLLEIPLAPQRGLEPRTTRLTAERSTIELLGNF